MFAEYQKQVLLTYHEKKTANQLSLNLINTTPGRLREECIAVFSARYDHHDDEKTLRLFFGQRDDAADYLRAIRNFKAEKFKPLDNFLKSETSVTQEKNIELLAWLIGFRPRPYQWDRSYTVPERPHQPEARKTNLPLTALKEENLAAETTSSAGMATTGVPTETKNQQPAHGAEAVHDRTILPHRVKMLRNPGLRNIAILLLLLCASGGGVFWAWNVNTNKEQCMCWAGDHYRSISCSEKLTGSDIFGMDSLRIANFKKITRPDTLTQRSLGHVWYSKIDGDVEFYTAGGLHPVHRERKLKPLTIYILNKYVSHAAPVSIVKN